ncbi:MAG: hypothetical protein [Circular genetic element sp.]|nr:MAG: hypothetical protein [Circular genetic element sp.]
MRLAENVNLLYKDKFAKVIKLIQPEAFFIDYIKVNWQIPFKEVSISDSLRAKRFQNEIFQILKKRILIWKANSPEANGMMVLIDQYYNIQIDFKGSFFIKTEKIQDDIIPFYKWFLEIDNMIMYYWGKLGIGKGVNTNKYPTATISRLDFATQKESTFLKSYIPIVSPHKRDIVNEFNIPFKDKRYISGITIGPEIGRRTENIFFRAYDKRFEGSGAQTCLQRFKSLEYVRKEWMMRSRFLRKNNIKRPEDLVMLCKNPRLLSLLIKKIRKSKDCLLHNDNKLYKSLHDFNARESVRNGTDLTLKEFNDIYKMTYNIFLKKASKKDVKKLLFNPYKQNLGLLKYAQNMKRNEFIEFQYQLLESMRSEIFDNYDLKEKNDIDQSYYDKISEMIDTVKSIKIKKK